MLISVVIATRNRRRLLEHTLPSVIGQDYPPERLEIVLVVDGATDGTARWARGLRPRCLLEVIEQDNCGPAVARNAGIEAAGGEIVLFLDDDIRCDTGLVREHVAGHSAEAGVLVHGAVFLANESPRTLAARTTGAWYEHHNAAIVADGGLRPDRNVYLNANSSLGATVLRELGGFDEAIPFPREDFELGLRIWKAGVPLRYRPRATAYEVFTKSSRDFVRNDAGEHARADLMICRKHPDYRPYSALATQDPPTPLRAAARRAFRRLPRSAERTLDPGVDIAERLMRHEWAGQMGVRLLALQRQMVFDRGASDAAGSAGALEDQFDRWIPALLYHRVGAATPSLHPDLTVSPLTFERQISWLSRRGYTGIRPSQWQAWRLGHGTLPEKPILLTFDDGYADLAEHALPILRRHGFGAAIFVVTDRLGGTNTWDATVSGPTPQLMSADQVAYWAQNGIEFGSHSRTHPDLSSLTVRELEREVRGSCAELEQIIGAPITCFAYPYGHHEPPVRQVVSATYDLAFTAAGGVNGLATPPHLLRRAPAGRNDSALELEWRAWTGSVPFSGIRDVLRIRSRFQRSFVRSDRETRT